MKRLLFSAMLTASVVGLGACSGEATDSNEPVEEVKPEVLAAEASHEASKRLSKELETCSTVEEVDRFLAALASEEALLKEERKALERKAKERKEELEEAAQGAERARLLEKIDALTTSSEVTTLISHVKKNDGLSKLGKQAVLDHAEAKYEELSKREQEAELERLEGILSEKETASELDTFYASVGTNEILNEDGKKTLQQRVLVKKKKWLINQEEEVDRLEAILASKTTGPELETFKQNIGTNPVLAEDRKQALQQKAEQKRQEWEATQQRRAPRGGSGGGASGTVNNNLSNTPAPAHETNQRFANCTEMRKVHPHGVPSTHPAYESKHDRDKDGWACER